MEVAMPMSMLMPQPTSPTSKEQVKKNKDQQLASPTTPQAPVVTDPGSGDDLLELLFQDTENEPEPTWLPNIEEEKTNKTSKNKTKAKLTSRERRERHREVVRRSYHRNKQTLAELKGTVATLEKQFHALTVARHPLDGCSTEVAQREEARLNELREQCQTLNMKSEALRREGVRLQGLLLRYEEFSKVVQECMEDENQDDDDEFDEDAFPMEGDEDGLNGMGKVPAICSTCVPGGVCTPAPISMEAREAIGYKLLSDAAAARLVTEIYQGIRTFTFSGRTVTTGARVMGWEDKRLVDGSEVRFSLRKVFPGHSSLDFMARTWQCLSDPGCSQEKFHGLMQLRILQRFNDDTLIALRDIVSADNSTIYRCVYLLFRLRTNNGFLICTRSLDNLDLEKPKCKVARKCRVITWINMFGWFLFDQQGGSIDSSASYQDTGVKVEYGGLIDYRDVMQVSTLVLDTLSTVLRWEVFAVGPIFTLPPSTDLS